MSKKVKSSLIAALCIVLAACLTVGLVLLFVRPQPVSVLAESYGAIRFIDVDQKDGTQEGAAENYTINENGGITGLSPAFTGKYMEGTAPLKLKNGAEHSSGVTINTQAGDRLRLNIPKEVGGTPVKYIEEGAFDKYIDIADIQTPEGVYWQVKATGGYFTVADNLKYALNDGKTVAFSEVTSSAESAYTLVIPSPVWYDKDSDGVIDSGESTYEYAEHLGDQTFASTTSSATHLNAQSILVTKNVINLYDGNPTATITPAPDDSGHEGYKPGEEPGTPGGGSGVQDPDSVIAKSGIDGAYFESNGITGSHPGTFSVYSDEFVSINTITSTAKAIELHKTDGIKLSGKGTLDTSDVSKSILVIQIILAGPADITVSAKGGDNRTLKLVNETNNDADTGYNTTTSYAEHTFSVKAAGTYYMYSSNSGINVASIQVVSTSAAAASISAPAPIADLQTDPDLLDHGSLRKNGSVESIYFATGRTKVLSLYDMTFEDYTKLKLVNLSAGVLLAGEGKVFQGALNLEHVFITDEGNPNVPNFYVLGEGGALYTDNFSYKYYDRDGFNAYICWYAQSHTPVQNASSAAAISAPAPNATIKSNSGIMLLSAGDTYYANQDGSGIPVPYGSFVFDFGTDSEGNDFSNYTTTAGVKITDSDYNYKFITTAEFGKRSGTSVKDVWVYNATSNDAKIELPTGATYNDTTYTYGYLINKLTRNITINIPSKGADGVASSEFVTQTGANGFNVSFYVVSTKNANQRTYTFDETSWDKSSTPTTVNNILTKSNGAPNVIEEIKAENLSLDKYYSLYSNNDGCYVVAVVITPTAPASTDPDISVKFASDVADKTFYASSAEADKTKNIEITPSNFTDPVYNVSKLTITPPAEAVFNGSTPVFTVSADKTSIILNKDFTPEHFKTLSPSSDSYTATFDVTYTDGDINITKTFPVTLKAYPETTKFAVSYDGTKHTDSFTVPLEWDGTDDATSLKFTYTVEPENTYPVEVQSTDLTVNKAEETKTITVSGITEAGGSFTVTCGSKTITVTITVTKVQPEVYAKTITVDKSAVEIKNGESATVKVTVTYEGDTAPKVYWYTSFKNRVTVTETEGDPNVENSGTAVYTFTLAKNEANTQGNEVEITFWAYTAKGVADESQKVAVTFEKPAAPVLPADLTPAAHNKVRYQRLVMRPALVNGVATSENPDTFSFTYKETTEIGIEAFMGTQLTVINIPDRIEEIGDSAFMMSDKLQTVYLPAEATLGKSIFGAESDADPDVKTVYTAGKKNFVIIAPSRQSYNNYLAEIDNKADAVENHDNTGYIYSRYLAYEVEVTYRVLGEGDNVTASQTETKLFGKSLNYGDETFKTAAFTKATEFTKWANNNTFNTDGNAITDLTYGHFADTKKHEGLNTKNYLSNTKWFVEAGGWYWQTVEGAAGAATVNPDALQVVEGNATWYFGATEITDYSALLNGALEGVQYESGVLPYSIVLTNKSGDKQLTNAAVAVPGFQNVGTVELGGSNPVITVNFDFTGYRPTRYFSNFDPMRVDVTVKGYAPYTADGSFGESITPTEEAHKGLYNGQPYDAGKYDITLSLNAESKASRYDYYWYGTYNGARLTSGQTEESTEFNYTLIIEPREISVPATNNVNYVEGNDSEVVILENNVFYSVESYKALDEGGTTELPPEQSNAKLSENGYPYQEGAYHAYLKLHDPKYDNAAESTPNLVWVNGETDGEDSSKAVVLLEISSEPKVAPPQFIEYMGGMPQNYGTELSFEYSGTPVLEELFGSSFSKVSMRAQIEYTAPGEEAVAASSVDKVGEYTVKITPAPGYAWQDHATYQGEEVAADAELTYKVTVTPVAIDVPADQLIVTKNDAEKLPYEYLIDSAAGYTVKGYAAAGTEVGDYSTLVQPGSLEVGNSYDVYLELKDKVNTKWALSDSNGDGIIHVGLDIIESLTLEKPVFNPDLGEAANEGKTLTITYNPSFVATYPNIFDGYISTYMSASSNPALSNNAGEYTIKISLKEDSGATWADKSSTPLDFTLIIEKAKIGEPVNLEQTKNLSNGVARYTPANSLYTVVSYAKAGWSGTVPNELGEYTVTLKPRSANYTWSNHEGAADTDYVTAKLTVATQRLDLPTFAVEEGVDGTTLTSDSENLTLSQIFDLAGIKAYNGANPDSKITLAYTKDGGVSTPIDDLDSAQTFEGGVYEFAFTAPEGAVWKNPNSFASVTGNIAKFTVILGAIDVEVPTAKPLTYSGEAFDFGDIFTLSGNAIGNVDKTFEITGFTVNGEPEEHGNEVKNAGTYTLTLSISGDRAQFVRGGEVVGKTATVEVVVSPAKLTVTAPGSKYTVNVAYDGSSATYTKNVTTSEGGLVLSNPAQEDGVVVEFTLTTNASDAKIYSSKDGTLTVDAVIKTAASTADENNYEKTVDYSGVEFVINVVKNKVTKIDWQYDYDENVKTNVAITDDNKSHAYHAVSHAIEAWATYTDESGEEHEKAVELVVTLAATKGSLTADNKIKDVGTYTAEVKAADNADYDLTDVAENLKIELEITPYLIELQSHDLTTRDEYDAVFGQPAEYNSDVITITCFDGEYSETVYYKYTLNAETLAGVKKTEIGGVQYVNAGVYVFDDISKITAVITDEHGAETPNPNFGFKIADGGSYKLQVVPLEVKYSNPVSAQYKGYIKGDEGAYKAEDLALTFTVSGTTLNQADVSEYLSGKYSLQFKEAMGYAYGSPETARNAGKYVAEATFEDTVNFTYSHSNHVSASGVTNPVEFTVNKLDIITELSEFGTKTYNGNNYLSENTVYVKIYKGTSSADRTTENEITEYFYNADHTLAENVDENGVFGAAEGTPAVTLQFFTNKERTTPADELKEVGTYYSKATFASVLEGSLTVNSSMDDAHRIITIAAAQIELFDINLDELKADATFVGLEEFLVYSAAQKTFIITNAAGSKTGAEGNTYTVTLADLAAKVPDYETLAGLLGGISGAEITVTVKTANPAAAGALNISITADNVRLDGTSDITVGTFGATLTGTISRFELEVTWSHTTEGITENNLTLAYDGTDHLTDIGYEGTLPTGGKLTKSSSGTALTFTRSITYGSGKTATALENAQTYTVTLSLAGDRAANYDLSGNTLTVVINPHTVTAEDIKDVFVWSNQNSGTTLQSGKYSVEGLSEITADNSFAKYRNGEEITVVLSDVIPKFNGENMFSVAYVNDTTYKQTASEKGAYTAKAVLTLTTATVGNTVFNNYVWADSIEEEEMHDGGSYGETYAIEDGNFTVEKEWYIVELSGGITVDPNLPYVDADGNGTFSRGDYYGWVFGAFPEGKNFLTAIPQAEKKAEGAKLLVSFGRVPDNMAAGFNSSSLPATWAKEYELDRNFEGTFESPTKVDDSEEQIGAFLNKWINKSAPAGRYMLYIYIPAIMAAEGGAELYPEYSDTFTFVVTPAPITAENKIANLETDYNGNVQYGEEPTLSYVENITALRSGDGTANGWANDTITRPDTTAGGAEVNIKRDYFGITDSGDPKPQIMYGAQTDDYYLPDSPDWNKADNHDLPLNVNITSDAAGEFGYKNNPYTLYYKYSLKNHEEFLTVGAEKLTAENSSYTVTIKALRLKVSADTSDNVALDGGKVSWTYKAASGLNIKLAEDSGTIQTNSFTSSLDKVTLGYRFVPADESFVEKADSTQLNKYVNGTVNISDGSATISGISGLDAGNYVLRIYMANYGESDMGANQNYTVLDEKGGNTGIMHINVTVSPVQISSAADAEAAGFTLPVDQTADFGGEQKNYTLSGATFKIVEQEEGRVNAGEYNVYIAFNSANYVFAEPADGITLEDRDGTVCLVVKLVINPRAIELKVEGTEATYGSVTGATVSMFVGGDNITANIRGKYSVVYKDQSGKVVDDITTADAGVYTVTVTLLYDPASGDYAAHNMYFGTVPSGFTVQNRDLSDETDAQNGDIAEGTFTINKADIVISQRTLSAHSHVYGTAYGKVQIFSTHYSVSRVTLTEADYDIALHKGGAKAEPVNGLYGAGTYRVYFTLTNAGIAKNYNVKFGAATHTSGEAFDIGEFVIDKAVISVSAARSLVYNGQADRANEFALTVTNAANSAKPERGDITLSSSETVKDAKTYMLTATLSAAAFENFSFAGGSQTATLSAAITPLRVKATLGGTSPVYDGTAKAATVTFEKYSSASEFTGDINAEIGTAYTLRYNGGSQAVNAGDYTVTVTLNGITNFYLDPATAEVGTFTIQMAKLTVEVSGEATYNGRPQRATLIFRDESDIERNFSNYSIVYGVKGGAALAANARPENAGEYEVRQITLSGAAASNYTVQTISGTFKINAATVEIRTNSYSATYTGSALKPNVTVYRVGGGSIPDNAYTVAGATNAGTHSINVTLTGTNYKFAGGTSVKSVTFVIDRAKLTVGFNGDKEFAYTAQNQFAELKERVTLTNAQTSIVPAADKMVLTLTRGGAAATEFKEVGEYVITVSLTPDALQNFQIDGSAQITGIKISGELIVELHWSEENYVFDGEVKILPTVYGVTDMGTRVDLTATLPSGVQFVNAGEYTFTATTSNARFAFSQQLDLSKVYQIAKATPAITAQESKTATFSGSPIGIETPDVPAYVQNVVITYNGFTLQPINAGEYTVVITVPETENYNGATVTVSLVITKKQVTVNWGSTSFEEGTAARTPYLGLSEELKEGTISAVYTCNGITLMGAPTAAGEYTVTVSLSGTENYVLGGTVTKTFTIGNVSSQPSDGNTGTATTNDGLPALVILAIVLAAVSVVAAIPCTVVYVRNVKKR